MHKRPDTVNVIETLNLAILQGFQSCYIAAAAAAAATATAAVAVAAAAVAAAWCISTT